MRAITAWTSAWCDGQLGAVGQRDRHHFVERPGRVDQGDLSVVVLQRLDHRAGVEPEHLGEVGALTPPLLRESDGLLLELREQVPGPVDLDLGNQFPAQVARSARPAHAHAQRSRGHRHTSRDAGARWK